MQKYSIPVRFSLSDKILLQKQSKLAGLPLSTYIRNTVLDALEPVSKTQSLMNQLDNLNITQEEIAESVEAGKGIRKGFKLTSTK